MSWPAMRAVMDLFRDEDGPWLRDHPRPDPTAQATFKTLAFHAHRDTATAWPSIRLLVLETGLDRRTVQRALARLEGDGYITRVDAGRGRGKTTRWQLNIEVAKGGSATPFGPGERAAQSPERAAHSPGKGVTVPPGSSKEIKRKARAGDAAYGASTGACVDCGTVDGLTQRRCAVCAEEWSERVLDHHDRVEQAAGARS